MNRLYRLIWNVSQHCWQVASERARGHVSRSGHGGTVDATTVDSITPDIHPLKTLTTLCLIALAGLSTAAYAAPTGGAVTTGSAGISQAGNTTTIGQNSQNVTINWNTFSSAANEAVIFNQPNSSAIALNRITGSEASSLLGSLTANGQVFIINPNGILFGAGSQVNVGGLVASTLNLSDSDFNSGNYTFANVTGNNQGNITNQGNISTTTGGYVALLGKQISNQGSIVTPEGTTLLAAGDNISLNLNNGSLLSYSVNQGTINALAENKQLIRANGGTVILTAQAANDIATATVNNTGVIEAKSLSNKNGTILLLADMQTGTVNVGGTLDASAPNGGNGGFIETSAAHVKVAEGTVVTTAAPFGLSGTWLIDPTDFYISATDPANGSSYMSNATLASNLNSGNVTIQTLASGAGNGDIFVNDGVSWDSANSLTLNAIRDVNINAYITTSVYMNANKGNAGGVTVNAGRDITLAAGKHISTDVVAAGSGHTVGNAGDVTFTAGRDIFGANSNIYARAIKYQYGSTGGRGGNVTLTANGGNVDFGGIYTFTFQNDTGGTIGNAGNVAVTANGNVTVVAIDAGVQGPSYTRGSTYLGRGGNIDLTANTGSITVNGALTADVRRPIFVTSFGQGGNIKLNADANRTCLSSSTSCGTVVFGTIGSALSSGTGRVDIYYNPSSYSTPTDFSSDITGGTPYTAWMLVNDVGQEAGGTRGLQAVGSNLAGNYALGTNIDAASTAAWNTGAGFAPIGSNASKFTGQMDGMNHSISGLAINRPLDTDVGLFGATDTTSTIKNVGLVASSVTGSENVAGLVGRNAGTVSNSYNAGSMTGHTNVAGLIGRNSGTVSNSYASGSVSGVNNIGGLVGMSTVGSIDGSYANGTLTQTNMDGFGGGGLLGSAGSTTVTRSFWNTTTSGWNSSQGGTGLTTAEMQDSANFTSATVANGNSNPAWDFTNGWVMYNGYTAPLLRSFMTALTVTANNTTKTYDGLTSLASGVTYSTAPNANLLGTFNWGGEKNVGTHAASGLYSNQQGYIINTVGGALTVNKADLHLIGTQVYDGSTAYAGSNLLANGANGETFTITGAGDTGNLSHKNVQTASTLASLTGLSLGASSNGGFSSNYNALSTVGSSVNVTKADLAVTGLAANNKMFDANSTAILSGTATIAALAGDDVTLGGTASGSFVDRSVANGKAVTVTGNTISGVDAANYNLLQQAGLTADITPSPTFDNPVYDGVLQSGVGARFGEQPILPGSSGNHAPIQHVVLNADAGNLPGEGQFITERITGVGCVLQMPADAPVGNCTVMSRAQ